MRTAGKKKGITNTEEEQEKYSAESGQQLTEPGILSSTAVKGAAKNLTDVLTAGLTLQSLRQLGRRLLPSPLAAQLQCAPASGRMLCHQRKRHLRGQSPKDASSSCISHCCQLKPAWLLCHGCVTSAVSPSCRLLIQCLRPDSEPAILSAFSCICSRPRNTAKSRQPPKKSLFCRPEMLPHEVCSCLSWPHQAAALVEQTSCGFCFHQMLAKATQSVLFLQVSEHSGGWTKVRDIVR